ncbi:MAG: hypothetical protein NC938_02740 [Candidatus Omnitrophica bacterium]|nr:hypothetical protein [Candidatus Omnitrophota bacterium]MCM8790597.1 hypothetical protein [Candidatus Omnitrophota bacterium]
MKKNNSVIFIDDASQAHNCVKNSAKYGCDPLGCVIAMNPVAYVRLKRYGIKAQNTLPYLTNESHMRVVKKSEQVIRWFRENAKFVDFGMNMDEAYRNSFVFYVRFVVNECLCSIEVIINAIRAHEACMVLASSRRISARTAQIQTFENYLGFFAEKISSYMGLEFKNIDDEKIKDNGPYDLAKDIMRYVMKYIYIHMWAIANTRNYGLHKRLVLFTTRYYQMGALIKKLQDELPGMNFCLLEGPLIPTFSFPDLVIRVLYGKHYRMLSEQKHYFDDLDKKIDADKDIFSYRGIPFAEPIKKKLTDAIYSYSIGEILWSIELDDILSRLRPYAIISSGNRLDETSLAKFGKKKAFSTILISHGSLVEPKNEYEKIEWGEQGRTLLRLPVTYLALQTPLAEGYLKIFPSSSNLLKTGPLIWGGSVNREISRALFNRMFGHGRSLDSTRVIVHASTPNTNKCSRPYIYETSDEYIESVRQLVEAAKNIPDTVIVVRFRPVREIGVAEITDLIKFSDNVVLSVKEPFIEVLGMADLLVSFSSTTIEEALQNHIPVLLFGGNGRYCHIPAFEVRPDADIKKSAVYWVRQAHDLNRALCGILELGIDPEIDLSLFDEYIYKKSERVSLSALLGGG